MVRVIGLVFVAFALSFSSPVAAETTLCTAITALPATISSQGVYCLKTDLATGIAIGNAITINTNNVTIDCNSRKIGGLAAGPGTQAFGIYADGRLNVTIRDCNIRGFMRGLAIDGFGTSGHRVENNVFDGNTYLGMRVAGDGVSIRGNRVINTGGTTLASGTYGGIILSGSGGYVGDNDVTHAYQDVATAPLKGIVISGPRNVLHENRVSSLVPAAGQFVVGLLLNGGQTVLTGNSMLMPPGTRGFPIYAHTSDICRGNTASGFDPNWLAGQSAYYCFDAGGNYGLTGS